MSTFIGIKFQIRISRKGDRFERISPLQKLNIGLIELMFKMKLKFWVRILSFKSAPANLFRHLTPGL